MKTLRYNNLIVKQEENEMAFIASFLQYFIIMLLLAAIAAVGIFAGKKLRDRKDAKNAAANDAEK